MDEDFNDYSGDEGFHEDSLTNEEYDTLYAVLPEAKKAMSSYNSDITEEQIKEALYYNYFELEPSLDELRKNFPKKKGMLSFFITNPCQF